MRIALTVVLSFLCVTVARAAHLAPWDPDGDGMRVGMSANGGGVVACRISSSGVESFSYDAVGNLLSASNSVACEAFAWDGASRSTGGTSPGVEVLAQKSDLDW